MDNEFCEGSILQVDIDKLSEVGNIGAGNAVTSLSTMLGKRVDMSIAKLQLKNISEFREMLGDEEQYITAMITEVNGDVNGLFLLALEIESTKQLIRLMLDKELTSIEEIDEIDRSLLCETGNILGGAYLSALTSLMNLKIDQSVPQMTMDMAGAILGFAAIELARDENEMLLLEANFVVNENLLSGTYLLMLDRESFNKIIKALDCLI